MTKENIWFSETTDLPTELNTADIKKAVDTLNSSSVEEKNRTLYVSTNQFYAQITDLSMYKTKNWKVRHYKKAYMKAYKKELEQ